MSAPPSIISDKPVHRQAKTAAERRRAWGWQALRTAVVCVLLFAGSALTIGWFHTDVSPEDYAECAARINELDHIPGIELNISCPNVKDGGMAFGVTCEGAASVVRAVRKRYDKTLIVKLSPNVTDIASIAKAVEAEGADSVSLINTLMGMSIDIERRQSRLSIGTGGLSGPCVKPVALRMVWQVARTVNIPVVGLGGIMNATDAIEFLMAGATAIEIGTANFIDPTTTIHVINGINEWLDNHGVKDVHEIIGCMK